LFAWLISHQPAVLLSQNKPAISNQPAVLFSQNKPTPAISHHPNEQAVSRSKMISLLIWIISHRTNQSVSSNQSAAISSHNKSTPSTNHQPNEQGGG
jgi:hypothetical protein